MFYSYTKDSMKKLSEINNEIYQNTGILLSQIL